MNNSPFPTSMDGPQPPEAGPEDDARFEARVEELRDGAFGWLVAIAKAVETNNWMTVDNWRAVTDDSVKQIILRILRDGLECSEDVCGEIAREIIEGEN